MPTATPDSRPRRSFAGVALAQLVACAPATTMPPADAAAVTRPPAPVPANVDSGPPAPVEPVEPAMPVKPVKPVMPVMPAVACTDGQSLSDGCTCNGKRCMDLCCVGSTCTHHASADGGWAKCMSRR